MRKPFLILTLACSLFAANEPATFTGVITDTLCGRSHGMMKAKSDEDCIKMCVKCCFPPERGVSPRIGHFERVRASRCQPEGRVRSK
jgi:hypothetical protein